MAPRRQRFAAPEEVAAQVKNWDDDVLRCRTYGHQWQPSRAPLNRKGFYSVTEFCPRCTCSRHYEMSTRGVIFGHPTIEYAEGYLTNGLGRIVGDAKGVVRLAAITHTVPEERLTAKESMAQRPRSRYTREALAGREQEAS